MDISNIFNMDISATQVYQDHDSTQATQRLLQNTQTDRTEQVGMLIIDSVPYSIFKGVNVVGRHPSCNIVLNDQTVSRRHAEIEAGVKQTWICDLHSSNKTRLNNELLRSSRCYSLQDGNTIDFGKIRAIYKIFDRLNESVIPMTPMAPPQKNRHRLVPETPESAEKLKNQSSILEEEISMIPDSQADNEKCTFRRPSIPPERRSTDRLKMYIQDSSLEESMEKSQNSILQESNVNEATVGDVSNKSSRSKTTKQTKETKETRDEKRSLSAIDANIEESIAKRPRREPQTGTYKIKDEHVNDSMNIITTNESKLKSTRIQNVNITEKKEITENTKLNPPVLTERPFEKTENRNDLNKLEEMPKIGNKRKRGKPKKTMTESPSFTNDKKHVTGENSQENPRIMPNNPSTSSRLLLTIERINKNEKSKAKRPRRETQTRTHKVKDEQDSISTVTSDDSFRSTRSRNTENSEKARTIESTKLNPVVLMKQVQLENKNNSKEGVAKIEKKRKHGRSKMVINDNSSVSTESDSLVSNGIRVPSEESQEIRKIMRNVRSTSFKAADNRKETTLDDKLSISTTTPKKTSFSTNSENSSLITSTPRTRSMSSSRSNISSSPSKTKLKIAFTGISSETYSKVFKKLGIVEVMDYAKCDVLVTDKVRRTVKFLCALAQGTPIVSIEWLNDSKTSENLLDWADYILKDPVAEAKFGFKLHTSLEKARKKKLLDGFMVLLTPNIAQPPIADLKSMIISCGGKPLIRAPPAWRKNTVILSTEDDISSAQRFLSKAPKGTITVQSTEFILTGILKQELDFVKYRLIS